MISIVEAAKQLGFSSTDPLYARAKRGLIDIVENGPKDRYISEADLQKLLSIKIPDGMKKCNICEKINFKHLFENNKDLYNSKRRSSYLHNHAKNRINDRKYRYGIT